MNGVRLVYPMEDRAMRFLHHLGNKFFSIAANRGDFGKIGPFGDFDLIFGAARYNLKIVDLPIRYRERTCGDINIQS